MRIENINKSYLDKVLAGEFVDHLYHLGISSTDECLKEMKDLKAVVMAGSGHRIERMAKAWHEKNKNRGAFFKFPKDERFSIFYSSGVLFCSHGMGMPSTSIALHELMKLVYYVKKGSVQDIEKIFWCRVGTSGGLVEPGTVVVTTQALCANFKPYSLFVLGKEKKFNSDFPLNTVDGIVSASVNSKIPLITGKTVGADCFYIEQNRADGAISFCNDKEKIKWLKKAEKFGVKNIEMESPVVAAFLNHWGFSNFAVICCVLVNRLKGDQIKSSKEELDSYSLNAETVLWNYLNSLLNSKN